MKKTSSARSSARMKSKTPWWPGPRPVISDTQAGGVSGLGVERSLARVPSSKIFARKGITGPSPVRAVRSLSTVNVAPSMPMKRVRTVISGSLSYCNLASTCAATWASDRSPT